MINRDFENNLKAARKKLALTQKELAELSNLSQGNISDMESGKRLPDLQNACNLAMALGVSLDWLCGISKSYQIVSPGQWLHYLDKLLCDPPKRNGKDIVQVRASGKNVLIILSGDEMVSFFNEYNALRSVRSSIGEDVYQTAICKLFEKYGCYLTPGTSLTETGVNTPTPPTGF